MGTPAPCMVGRHPYREGAEGVSDPFRQVEVRRAINGPARERAAGDDGLVAEIPQRLPFLLQPVTCLCNVILTTGGIPHQMPRVIVIPMDKPQKDPEYCASKRPIS